MASTGISTAVVTGNLTRDGELNESGKVLKVGIAVSRYHKENGEEVSFFDIKVLGNRAKALEPFLKKGTKVTVQGDLVQERWETKEGEKRSAVRILAQEIVLGSSPRESSQQEQRDDETGGW